MNAKEEKESLKPKFKYRIDDHATSYILRFYPSSTSEVTCEIAGKGSEAIKRGDIKLSWKDGATTISLLAIVEAIRERVEEDEEAKDIIAEIGHAGDNIFLQIRKEAEEKAIRKVLSYVKEEIDNAIRMGMQKRVKLEEILRELGFEPKE